MIFQTTYDEHYRSPPRYKLEKEFTNLIAVDIKNYRSTSKIKYEYDRRTDSHTFTPRPPYLVDIVTRGNRIVWDSADHGYKYGTQVFVGYDENKKRMLRVFFQSDFTSQLPRSPFPTHDALFKHFHGRHRSDYSAGNLLVLNVKNRHSTRTVYYKFDSRKNTHTFTALYPNLFGLILKGDKIVWQGNAKLYPDIVFLYPAPAGGYMMRFYFPSDDARPFHKPPWARRGRDYKRKPKEEELVPDSKRVTPIKPPKPIALDIGFNFSTRWFYFSSYNDISKYIPKDGYTFGSVKNVKFSEFFGPGLLIWKAFTPEDYSNTVELDNKGKVLTIYLGDGSRARVYRMVNKVWVADKDTVKVDKPKLDIDHVGLDISLKKSTKYYDFIIVDTCHDPFNETYLFLPKHSIKFNSVLDGKEAIWTSTGPNYAVRVTLIHFLPTDVRQLSITLEGGITRRFIKPSSGICQNSTWSED